MHCDKCNTDFPDGLRYCKWCGGPLVNRPRITSELHACPSCATTIQPGWTYCKACGERLHGASRESAVLSCPKCGAPTDPNALTCTRCGEDLDGRRATQIAQDSKGTTVIAKCSTCGERLDTGSLYCKACGSAAYVEETEPSGSALQCGACNNYSPMGSSACRVCGAPFVAGSRTVVDFAGATTIQQKAPTLPDLDEQMAARQAAQEEVESGANTWALTVTDEDPRPAQRPTGGSEPPPRPKGGADTNLLTGTAGAKSEQQAPTSIIDMGRITGPVEEQTGEDQQTRPDELKPTSPPDNVAPVSRSTRGDSSKRSKKKKPSTADFGSEEGNSAAGPESKTAVFVSPLQAQPPSLSPPDGIGSRQLEPQQSFPGVQGTREITPPAGGAGLDPHKTTEQKAFVPDWKSSATIESSAPFDSSQPEIAGSPVGQVSSPPAKRTGMTIVSVIVALLVVGGAIYAGWWFLFARVRPAPPVVVVEPPAPPPVVPTLPDKPPAPVIPEGMIAVAAGSYTIGRDNADPLEQPKHSVDIPAFLIDSTEVTNAAYKKFIDATGHKAPTNWAGNDFPKGSGNSPVTGVTWQDAADYAAWAGKRLPTEMEWEAAARGTDGRIYPWGDQYRSGAANIGAKPDDITADQYPSGIKEVGHYPSGASPSGALDMIGNAWEWVFDEIAPYPGNNETKLKLTPGKTYRVIRGGAYDGNKSHDATYRGFLDAGEAYPKVGFRCAKDAK